MGGCTGGSVIRSDGWLAGWSVDWSLRGLASGLVGRSVGRAGRSVGRVGSGRVRVGPGRAGGRKARVRGGPNPEGSLILTQGIPLFLGN